MPTAWDPDFKYQPMSGFPVSMQVPSYSGFKPKKEDSNKLPSFKGIDFQTGKQVDLANYFQNPSFVSKTTGEFGKPQEPSVPGIDPNTSSWLEFYKATSPVRLAEMEAAANISANLSARQLRQLYPYLSAAGAESTARNLAASQAYRSFTEQLPSNIQNIMASKQQQMATAALSEAERQKATAMQQDAATRFAGQGLARYSNLG